MSILSRISLFVPLLWLTVAFLKPDTQAQTVSETVRLPEGITLTGDTTEVRALIRWAEEHRYRHPEQARLVGERALQLAEALADHEGIGRSSILLGNLSFYFSDPYLAEDYYLRAQAVYEEIGDGQGIFEVLSRLGTIYGRRGDLEQALRQYQIALSGFERLGLAEEQARVLNGLGILHRDHGNRERDALGYYERALSVLEEVGKVRLTVTVLNGMGLLYASLSQYDEAEHVLMRALNTAEEIEAHYEAASTSANIGFVLNEQGLHKRALPFLTRAETSGNTLGNTLLLVATYDEMGKALMGLGQLDLALYYAIKSLALIHDVSDNQQYLAQIHLTLSQIYEMTGDPTRALAHYREYAVARDSVFSREKTEIIADMQARKEADEVQSTIERLEQRSQIQSLRQRLLLVGIGGLMVLLALLYYLYRANKRRTHLLREIDQAKSRLFANISHEFRTPITVILGGLQEMKAGRFGAVPDEIENQGNAMLRNAERLHHLIDGVMELTRLEAGHLGLQVAPGDLVLTLKRVVEAHTPLAERNRVAIQFTSTNMTCPRIFDPHKISTIVGNLLSNAIKFTPPKGHVHISLKTEKHVKISITDDGAGISADAQEKIFDRYAQLDLGMLKGGTGIGLTLAKELVKLHGGRLTVASSPGNGTTFTVDLPLQHATEPLVGNGKAGEGWVGRADGAPRTNGSLDGEESAATSLDQPTLLIIEDNDDVRAFIRRSLEETHRVLEAENGHIGLHRARVDLPDLVIIDVVLPDINGFEVAERLKSLPETECMPVVMLTARVHESDHVAGYDSGAEAYITKPFSAEILRAAIARLLEERKRLKRQLQARIPSSEETQAATSSPTGFMERARKVVHKNLHDENFGVDTMASFLGMSRHTLNRHMKQESGSSPSSFIRTMRLERARELLLNREGSVSEVAYAVGFKSLSHFTHTFRRHYDELPSSLLAV